MVRPQCRGCGFDPWLGNEDPTCHMVWPKGKEKLREKKKKKDKSFLDSEKHSCNCNTSCFLPHSLPFFSFFFFPLKVLLSVLVSYLPPPHNPNKNVQKEKHPHKLSSNLALQKELLEAVCLHTFLFLPPCLLLIKKCLPGEGNGNPL